MKFQGCVYFDLKLKSKTNYNLDDLLESIYDKDLNLSVSETTYSTYKLFVYEVTKEENPFGKLIEIFHNFCEENKLESSNVMNTKYTFDEYKIMDTTNGHNEKLVEYINYLYNKNSESFRPILQALFVRDMEEANDKGINHSMMYKDYNGFAYEMLQHVCDDLDLSVIIDFIRHKEIDDKGNKKYLYSNGWH